MGPHHRTSTRRLQLHTKVYPLALVKQKQLDEFLDENLKSNVYAHQNHQWHPQFLHLKERWQPMLVQDYRKLNMVTVKNAYPLPLIPDILNKVSEAKVSIH